MKNRCASVLLASCLLLTAVASPAQSSTRSRLAERTEPGAIYVEDILPKPVRLSVLALSRHVPCVVPTAKSSEHGQRVVGDGAVAGDRTTKLIGRDKKLKPTPVFDTYWRFAAARNGSSKPVSILSTTISRSGAPSVPNASITSRS
jgi:hypothetical protein